ncbi:glutamine-hydrolyzing GMP synthase [Candidatus Schneideria nysicola]|uniref:glutamine-hydrolyzing GMP synthase n=1 Tax=Candidatus Schneideria nysicola TaxID=1081631 RepID=UPI001CAA4223|nr:glutamine-hydrolyzing GMP synthase [Candidatus Schneideria nysicola]UAJ66090.1 glutamine-hydrolyzing GMP synthase [Candidatus Schneideria nysicola]
MIIIIDFGSQYTQLIARRIREIGVYCEIFYWDIPNIQEKINEFSPNGFILSGSVESSTKINSPYISESIFSSKLPILGICYGMQILALQLGGKVEKSKYREFGEAKLEIIRKSLLFPNNIQDKFNNKGNPILDVWMSHDDTVTSIPKGFSLIAKTQMCPLAVIEHTEKKIYGVQFHPEVTHTIKGKNILSQFVLEICQCQISWTPPKIRENLMQFISNRIEKKEQVILGLSGGIDSLVTAMLLNKIIGERLICIFIDNGLLYTNDTKKIVKIFSEKYKLNIKHVLAEDIFLKNLTGISEPEEKRKVIGRTFIKIFEEQALKYPYVKWLAQGTIYSDLIESGIESNFSLRKKNIIKSHHNVGGLPKNMKMQLIEPLKNLFKDEVRKIGLDLGLPYDVVYQHPFPGPGIGIRIIGEIKKEYCDILRHVDRIFIEELKNANLYSKIGQAFSIFLPVRSVGIMGDERKYNWVVALRAVDTTDFMTAKVVKLPYDFLSYVSNRIINEVRSISRIVYDITSKPPSTIEWE